MAVIALNLFGVPLVAAQNYDACPSGYYDWPGYGCVVNPPYGYHYYAPPPVAMFPTSVFAFGLGVSFRHEFGEHEFHRR